MKAEIVTKKSFRVTGREKTYAIENCMQKIPQFWQEHNAHPDGIHGVYGISFMHETEVTYCIADDAAGQNGISHAFEEGKWLVVRDHGPLPQAMQNTIHVIEDFYLPAHPEIRAEPGVMIEYYTDPCGYEKGGQDENYAYEIWMKIREER